MLILGSCVALNLNYSGCCIFHKSPPCGNNGCFCDVDCHTVNDCCNDIDDIGCHPLPSVTLGKIKSDILQFISHSFNKFI